MTPVKDRWSAERKATFDDVEIHLPEEWEGDQHTDVPVYHKRRSAGLWTALASLAVVVAVMAAYGYSVLSNQNAQLAWLPGLMKSVTAVRDRTNGLEASLKQWSAKQNNLATKVQQLDTGWKSELSNVRQNAAVLTNSAYRKEHEELNQRAAALNEQIAEMTSRQKAEQSHVAQLEKQLAVAQQELTLVRRSYARDLASLRQQQISNQRAIAAVGNKISTEQINFEAAKKRDVSIVSGVTLHLTGLDMGHQRFRGWLLLEDKGQKIVFRRQAVETPLVFYPVPGGEAYELVVTRVRRKSVVGYMLVPGNSEGRPTNIESTSTSSAVPQ